MRRIHRVHSVAVKQKPTVFLLQTKVVAFIVRHIDRTLQDSFAMSSSNVVAGLLPDRLYILHLVAITSFLLIFYQIAKITYRVCFHPLSSFPGPKIASVSRW